MGDLGTCRRVFFSLPEVTDPGRHRDYNAWHQLDHQPENLALPGVLHGDRWVRTPACRDASAYPEDATLGAADYVAMYWFGEPVEQQIAQWVELGTTTGELGRRPELGWVRRRLTGFFAPLEGHVAPGVQVSAAALPYRAHRGVLLDVLRVDAPGSTAAGEALRAWHREHLAAVRTVPGVAGTWTFASRDVTLGGTEPARSTQVGEFQIALHFCETDPVGLAAQLDRRLPDGLDALLRTPLQTVAPFEWDWFDR